MVANYVLIDPLIGGKRPTAPHKRTGQGTCSHGSSLHPGYSNPLPRESLPREAAFTTDRRVVKLEIRDNGASIIIEQTGGYVASEVIVVLRCESAGRSVGEIERRP